MAETLHEFAEPVIEDGKLYAARACGSEMRGGLWQGWIEFIPIGGGEPVRSSRETTQPNRQDTVYWATGLTPVYLEGALHRALNPLTRPVVTVANPPVFPGPATDIERAPAGESVLNPFSVYRKGEALLRRQLSALSPWHLVNIIRVYRLSDEDTSALNAQPAARLVELIVDAVSQFDRSARR
jgi:hypothetical protein